MARSAPSHAHLEVLSSEQAAPRERLRSVSGVAVSSARAEAPAPSRVRVTAGRLSALDAARVVATLGVLWVHVVEVQGHGAATSALGRYGTSFYIVAAVLLAFRGVVARPERTAREHLRLRMKRLLAPFVAWSCVYAAFYGSHAWRAGSTLEDLCRWWGPFAGTARHLWFLPFAFAMGQLVTWLTPWLLKQTLRRLAWGTLVSGVVAYFLFYRVLFFALPRLWMIDWHLHRLDRWVEEIPFVVLALGGAATIEKLSPAARARIRAASLPLALGLLGAAVALNATYAWTSDWLRAATGSEGRFLAHAIGLALMVSFLLVGERGWLRGLAFVGRFTYFVFLAHVLVLDYVLPHLASRPGYGTVSFAVGSTLGIFAVCWGIGAATKRVPFARWLSP